jgi:hypothetical protein
MDLCSLLIHYVISFRLETEPVVLSTGSSRDDIGTVAYLRLKRAEVVSKSETWSIGEEVKKVRLPSVLDEESQDMLQTLKTKVTGRCKASLYSL